MLANEPGGDTVLAVLASSTVSTVNLAEVYTRTAAKKIPAIQVQSTIRLVQEVVPFSAAQALLCGELQPYTARAGLSLGDRACLALAIERGAEVYTGDRAWSGLKLPCKIHLIR